MLRLLGLFILLMVVPARSADAIVIDLSEDEIEIRHSFAGADLILFGTIGDSAPVGAPSIGRGRAFDVVIVVRGPEAEAVVRKKALTGGVMWINRDEYRFAAAPGYYAVAANRSLSVIAKPEIYAATGIGFEYLDLGTDAGATAAEDPAVFQNALYRLRSEEGLYRQEIDSVDTIGEGLFRTNVRLPANVPTGTFIVDAYVFEAGRIIAADRIELTVNKAGFERLVYTFAHDHPLFYGLFAVLVALTAGWVAGLAGKK